MDLSKLARLLLAVKTKKENQVLNEIDVSIQFPDDLQISEAGYNSLHLSVMKEDVQLIMKLLDAGADLTKQGARNGHTPLHLFIKHKTYNKDKKIHELTGRLEEQEIADILLSEQVKRNNAFNPKCSFGVSHLHIACMFDHFEAVELLLKAGESVNQVISTNCSSFAGWAPLHIAITYSAVAAAKLLFDYKADIHLKDALGKSPLHRLLKRQLDAMDNITLGKRANTAPVIREINRLEMIICALLKTRQRSKMNFVDDIGLSAFHVACSIRDPFVVEYFPKEDVDINKPLNNNMIRWAGWTPLHFAACCNIETVKLLIKYGADITIKNTKGETPLDFCIRRYSPMIIHSILSIKEEFGEILLSDQSTKLLDLILAMDNCDEFNHFLQNLSDINIIVPHNSSIWPGYSIFHLAISMHERTKDPKEYIEQLSDPDLYPESYTCTEAEEQNYWRRIVVCLARQCSLTTKDVNGMSPVHLAFKLRKANVDKLLNCCRTNETDLDGLSFLHIACAVGNKNVVERFNNDIENPVKTHFQWCREKHWLAVQAKSTALHVAVTFGHREIVEYLLQKNANVYAQDLLGFTPIHLSAFSQPIANLFLSKIKNLKEVISRDGMSHLHLAAFTDNDTVIKKLVRSGANVNVVSKSNIPLSVIDYMDQTPLHVAVKMGNLKAVRMLIEVGADIHATSSRSKYDTPLQGAMRTEPNEMTDEFVKKLHHEIQTKEPIEACGVTLLHFACAVFDIKWVKKLLDKGADPNAQICVDENYKCDWNKCTPLHLLLIRDNFVTTKLKNLMSMVKLLVRHKADVTLQDENGYTPLLIAEKIAYEKDHEEKRKKKEREKECKKKNIEEKGKKKKLEKIEEVSEMSNMGKDMYSIADFLLNYQKSYAINPATRQGLSHFHYACKRNKVEIVRKFLQSGVDVNHATDLFEMKCCAGFTPLHFALSCESFEVAKVLLEYNANVKIKDIQGNTPLHTAALYNVDDVQLLDTVWRMGADIKEKNWCKATPLDLLIQSDFISYDQLKFFFDRGCLIEFEETESHQGIIGHLLRIGRPDHREAILRLLFESCNLAEKIKNGFNAIQSFVSISPGLCDWTVDRYLGGIQFFMYMGCDLDGQSSHGKTPLHSAVCNINVPAIEALLLLGSDINITDYSRKELEFPSLNPWSPTEYSLQWNQMRTVLSGHVWKMNFVGLYLDKSNVIAAENFWWLGFINMGLEQRCKDELEKMSRMKINEKWTMKDFLSESKIVIEYQTMSLSQRRNIDDIFKSHADLRRMFPEFCGLLMLQYRKAISNIKLYWLVQNAITSMVKLELPDECWKSILNYFDINKLKKKKKDEA